MSVREYREIEAGERVPSWETFDRICRLFGWPQTLGEPAARELLEILQRSDADRPALIGRLHVREDAARLAELLMDLEGEVGEIARLRLVHELRQVLQGGRGT